MCHQNKKCCAWISLDSFGIQSLDSGTTEGGGGTTEGCLKNSTWFNSLSIPCTQSILDQMLYINTSDHVLYCTRNVAHGKFGYIDSALYKRQNNIIEVYVKRPIISGKSLLYEACIQKLVCDNLKHIGFPTGAPRIISLFRLRDNSICFAMAEIKNSISFDTYLRTIDSSIFSSVVIDCLFQLCAMTWYLDTTLGINHRDLKPSNFLVVCHEPVIKTLQIDNIIVDIESRYSLTFIDFGFSCLGSTETHISDISLSTVYSKDDPCPKEGRDLYLFLALMYVDFYSKLTDDLLNLFESWLNLPGSNITTFMKKDKEHSKKWLYFIAGNEQIKKFNSTPYNIVKGLQSII
jgi:serine/threonine protein kinase